MSAAKLYIGTSGWHYKHWKGLFYPDKLPASEMFAWYSRLFDTVEINNTFYHLPDAEVFRNWRTHSPAGFIYAVKGSRFITHLKKLKDPEVASGRFLTNVENLEEKLGPILFQLPPHWDVNLERLEEFAALLPQNHRYVFEFRDERWNTPAVMALLRKYNCALCLHDWGTVRWPMELTANFTYIRFHGPWGSYNGSYTDEHLTEWSQRISGWREKLTDIYTYFNNDIGGHAITNAQTLKRMLNSSFGSEIREGVNAAD